MSVSMDSSGMDMTFEELESQGASIHSAHPDDDAPLSVSMTRFGLASLGQLDIAAVRAELRAGVRDMTERCLFDSAKWAAENLIGLPEDEGNVTLSESLLHTVRAEEHPPDAGEYDRILLAKVYFETGEYRRAAHRLGGAESDLGKFLRWYALYLAGEKRKEEDMMELVGPLERSGAVNGELVGLAKELGAAYQDSALDGYGLYLYGVVLKAQDAKAKALSMLLAAVTAVPVLWAGWKEIAGLCTDTVMAAGLPLPDHWAKTMFVAELHLEMQQNSESLMLWEELGELFVESNYVVGQAALANYNLREFGVAGELFEALLETDPYRLDNLDTYSNILYVKEEASKLSQLAHTASRTEKYRPETCCVIGNYYSLKTQHEKAVVYFQRALKLDRSFLSAWTLMGHEYVEMKNTPAAVEAYRRAVDISPRDYRAWYGLGQTYEILDMPFYALYYYRKATTLRPYDARMWCAMANCFEQVGRVFEAIKCYERAQSNSDRNGIALNRLANLYDTLGDKAKAAYYFERNLARLEAEGTAGRSMVKALIYLAVYYKDEGNYAQAELFCSRLHDFGGKEKEEAKILLAEIRASHRQNFDASMAP